MNVYSPVTEVKNDNGILIIKISSYQIQTTENHLFTMMRDGITIPLKASEIKKGDCFAVDPSLLYPGDKIVSTDGKEIKLARII